MSAGASDEAMRFNMRIRAWLKHESSSWRHFVLYEYLSEVLKEYWYSLHNNYLICMEISEDINSTVALDGNVK